MSVIVDCCADTALFRALDELGIRYYKSCSLDFLYSPVNTHPDMQIHLIDDKTAVVAPGAYEHYKQILPAAVKLIKGDANPGCTYPQDCAYNVARLGKKVIGNLSYIDAKIKEIYRETGCEFIDVKQGYTKCNLCIVNENAVITEDEGLFNTLQKSNICVLKIPSGSVRLNGFPYGFIGGASGFADKNTLVFCGDIKGISCCDEIEKFIKSNSVDIKCLLSTELQDFGSILYLDDGF